VPESVPPAGPESAWELAPVPRGVPESAWELAPALSRTQNRARLASSPPITIMRNAYELLYEKEKQLQRVRKEVEALRAVAPLLGEHADLATQTGAAAEPRLVVLPGRNYAGAH
jgi:hypothetical protein